MKMIYLDNAATTKPSEAAVAAAEKVMREDWGNPSSAHALGTAASRILESSRAAIISSLGIGAKNGRVIFTGSGTEANNTAIFGAVYSKKRPAGASGRGKILTTDSEHPSVEQVMRRLEGDGFSVVRIPTRGGKIDMSVLEEEADSSVIFASFMLANNETGALYDVRRAAQTVKAASPRATVHTDAVQAYMKAETSPRKLGVDMISVSAHKIHGPKGVGALWVSEEIIKSKNLIPYLAGGGQERGMRSGTENLPGVAAFGAAAQEAQSEKEERLAHVTKLYAQLERELAGRLPEVKLNRPERSVGYVMSLTLPGIKSETMLNFLSERGIYVSAGSACSAHSGKPSSVLQAFGLTEREADSTVRVSFSAENSAEELHLFCDALCDGVASLARMR